MTDKFPDVIYVFKGFLAVFRIADKNDPPVKTDVKYIRADIAKAEGRKEMKAEIVKRLEGWYNPRWAISLKDILDCIDKEF